MSQLEITTAIGCPLMCKFCPQGTLIKAYKDDAKLLTVENFKLFLKKIPIYTVVNFAGMVEPWVNPFCTEMVAHALESGFRVSIFTTLYGVSPEEAKKIVDIVSRFNNQIVRLVIHLPDINGNMRGWRYSTMWQESYLLFFDLYLSGKIDFFSFMTMDSQGRVHQSIEHLVNMKLDNWVGHLRAGSLDSQRVIGQHYEEIQHIAPVYCYKAHNYNENVVLPNGDVLICCMDYGMEHVLGNILHCDYKNLFLSPELNKILYANMQLGPPNGSICKKCNFAAPYLKEISQQQYESATASYLHE